VTTPYYADESVTVFAGDCLDVLPTLAAASVDAVVTDPPYALSFMSKSWDVAGVAFDPATWHKVARVLKPGGHLLAFGGSRTYHRLACAVEDAGFEIRDSIAWLYGSGFPKSLDVSKALDRAVGAEREVVGLNPRAAQQTAKPDATSLGSFAGTSPDLTAPATDAAKQWQGWGTALKPAHEPIVVARKSTVGTVAANVAEHGTGALNIDACRVGDQPAFIDRPGRKSSGGILNITDEPRIGSGGAGRWPTNVVLDESQARAEAAEPGGSTASPRRAAHSLTSRRATATAVARRGSSPRSATKPKPQRTSGPASTAYSTPPSNPSTSCAGSSDSSHRPAA
jgi:site-specific DNA-methyltransferase (adenine-specific)